MSRFGNFQQFGLFVLLIGAGIALIYVPSQVASIVERGAGLGTAGQVLYFGAVGLGTILIVGTLGYLIWHLWLAKLRKEKRKLSRGKSPLELSASERTDELRENLASVEDFRKELADEDFDRQLDPLIERIELKLNNRRLEIVAFGTISSGKSSLLNALAGRDVFATNIAGGTTTVRNEIPWPGDNHVFLVDTPGLGEVDGQTRHELATKVAKDSDIILIVVDGPLRQDEFELLKLLSEMDKRALVCLNKEDWYSESDREKLLAQIKEQSAGLVKPEDVLAVRSKVATRNRVRVLPDGQQLEEEVEIPLSIEPLAKRMMRIVKQDGQDLLLANLLLQSRGLKETAQNEVAASIDRRANQLVQKYMWAAGGAGALTSPLPVVDLAVGVGISSKMVIDLAQVYRQEIDLDIATRLLGQLGKQLLGYLGVQMAAPIITMAIASMLKAVPGVGQVAGGLLQGVVMAIVTRWIGNVFIEYFKNEMNEPEGGLSGLARREWERVTEINYLRKLVQEARKRHVDRE